MNFIRTVNKIMFTRCYSVFDVLVILTVVKLMELSVWWVVMYIPALFFSNYMERIVEADQNG